MSLAPEDVADTAWHARDAQECLDTLETAEDGLSADEAAARRRRFGDNSPPEQRRQGLLLIFLGQFRDPLIYILLFATLVSLVIGSWSNAGFIFAVVLLNATLGTFQEGRAERSTDALLERLRIRARVLRDGELEERDSRELVPGDVVEVAAGDRVPADLRVLRSNSLRADESLLTGESTPVEKQAGEALEAETPLAERSNLLFAGSSVVGGSARGVVCATAAATELGRIAASLSRGEAQAPPLVLRLRRFTRRIAVVVLLAVAVLAAIQWTRGAPLEQIFFLTVALAVSAIPAGLPVAITVAMSIGARRMAERNVIVRRLPAVEGLGSCNFIASDKTGTLTVNQLTIRRIVLADGSTWQVTGEGNSLEGRIVAADADDAVADGKTSQAPQDAEDASAGRGDDGSDGELPTGEAEEAIRALATTGALSGDASLEQHNGELEARGDAVDIALLVLARKLDLERRDLAQEQPREDEIEFESERRYAASFNRQDDQLVAHVKGATEKVLSMCSASEEERDRIGDLEQRLAEEGHRVLALASGRVAGSAEAQLDGLTFLGLVGLMDPLRPEVADAVARCRSAGVTVAMITGDHPATARAIAMETGIADADARVITGAELSRAAGDVQRRAGADDDAARDERPRQAADEDTPEEADATAYLDVDTRVYARIEPEQKTTIVEGLQAQGRLVAVTGDGVNDAPALRSAHIGVAMGQAGTDVARETADLVLTDDNFASVVAGIEQGRVAYDNVRKVVWLLLATGTAEVLLFFLAVLSGMPLPLLPVQLLWLNLVTNGVQDVALAFEKGEPGVLRRPPRPADQPVFDRPMIEQVLLSGVHIGLVAFAVFFYLVQVQGLAAEPARNLVLLLMVLFENVHTLSCRSEQRSVFRVPLRDNRLLLGAIVLAQGLHIGSMYTPWLGDVLQTQPVSPATWGILLLLALTVLIPDEISKFIRNRAASDRRHDEAG